MVRVGWVHNIVLPSRGGPELAKNCARGQPVKKETEYITTPTSLVSTQSTLRFDSLLVSDSLSVSDKEGKKMYSCDTYSCIKSIKYEREVVFTWLRDRKNRRTSKLINSSPKRLNCEELLKKATIHKPISPSIEKEATEQLLVPMEFPVELHLQKFPGVTMDELVDVVMKLHYQGLLEVASCNTEKQLIVVTSVNLERLSKLAQVSTLKANDMIPKQPNVKDEIEYLLSTKSVREKESKQMGNDIQELLNAKSVMQQLKLLNFQSAGGSRLREFCSHKTKDDCRRASSNKACSKLHFHRIVHPHTDQSLGDCSFLNTCFHMETCKFVHYSIDDSIDDPEALPRHSTMLKSALPRTKLTPPQWINCDMRYFDMSVLGKFAVIMADPPWDIHMELPYGTMGDDEMRQLNIPVLQDDGYIFLWVTGRAMELGRECLTLWGYERIDELIWVKTNQLQRLIRTGRTGHWINHGKEHCLVGVKGNPIMNRGIDTDVLVAEVRATSHKPDEVYGVIERLSPGTRKIELFGRMHNCQPNWITTGNQLDGIKIVDPDLDVSFYRKYPMGEMDTMRPPSKLPNSTTK